MALKKLEIAGFKSFAKTAVLSFPSHATAIVGPNGSGKSNITEAIRWVLGEQSMKQLRGKKGEDLIWNGSPSAAGGSSAGSPGVARMGKASVTLVFDNADGRIPMPFDEVSLTRKIFRDGAGEYLINDSLVRLRDVVELIARMGLGEQKHNIISQGEVDRLLLATPRERYRMLEEALGLRVWQLKKMDAERKLEAGERTVAEVQSLLRELAPHLKFLRVQAKRAEAREGTRRELHVLERIYIVREEREIATEEKALALQRDPLIAAAAVQREEAARLAAAAKEAEAAVAAPEAARGREREMREASRRRQELEREIGRLEGRMEAVRAHPPTAASLPFDAGRAADAMRDTLVRMRSLIREQEDISMIRLRFFPLLEKMEAMVEGLRKNKMPAADSVGATENREAEQWEEAVRVCGTELQHLIQIIAAGEEAAHRESAALREGHERLRALERALREHRDAEREALLGLDRLRFNEERLHERKEALRRDMHGMAHAAEASLRDAEEYKDVPQGELHKKVERLRLRLEEAGGIDESVITEYEETEARHAFLTKELDDVTTAAASLKELVRELDRRIAQDFTEGFAKIKDAFHDYFKIVFGGGSGKLKIMKQESRIMEDGSEEEKEREETEGIEIEVDLPRKRIHSLAMLSGGERALSAIALLFAITAVNPPPFLILDETDAALDEANSQRYAAILKELAKKTQLILVTHNRETMKSAGVLYGVTMGDDGVSHLLSLKLEEAEGYTNR